jgi:CRP-like cAMP-binding protein
MLRDAPEVSQAFPPSVYLTSYADFAINFTIKFFIEDYSRSDPIQSGVMDRLWYAFRREGISIPFPVRDVRYREAHVEEQAKHAADQNANRELLGGVELFQSLSAEEMTRLAEGARLVMFSCGENLCRQGEPGDSFYIIREGRVSVLVSTANGQTVTAAHLARGAFFGEMSLLTGEPRSGTIRAETDVEVLSVSKQDFAGLLQANVDLAGKLATVLEKRSEGRRVALSTSTARESAPETRSLLTARIRQFFGIG